MNSGGRLCWRGVPTERRTCHCGDSGPPPFDLVFPGSTGPAFSTVAQSTLANGSLLPLRTTALPEGQTDSGDGEDRITFASSEAPGGGGGNVAAKTWDIHPRSMRLLIGSSITLFIIILFLGCLLYCFTKKKKKKRHDVVQRPGPEGCEADRVPYDVPSAQPVNKNEFPLLQIDQPCRNNADTPATRDVSSGTESPFVSRNFPVLRTVKAAVVNMGTSPKKILRPVSRHDSSAPLVEHQASIFRDRWKDRSRIYGASTDDIDSNRLSADGEDFDHRDRLSTLNENDMSNGKLPTKLETLPSRMFPAKSVMDSPSSKRSNKRPDSSTPLFDCESISSSEA